jgi:predicted dehydrogenase/nucleoside-diphosphate-sugar epimerase
LDSPNATTGMQRAIRSAIVGTGFIADFHARGISSLPNAELVAVCDANRSVADAFAAGRGAKAYSSIDDLLREERIDVVHVLSPPDLHHRLARKALEAGAHVFVEKPMCVSTEETADLVGFAQEAGLSIGVNHNMLFSPAYERLRKHVRDGDLGPIDYLSLTHLSELAVMRVGPFSNWIVREPQNSLLEIGSHLMSELIDLVGEPDSLSVSADRDLLLPGGARVYRRWRIHALAGRTAVDLTLEFSPGFPQRTIVARGLLGSAFLDFNANTCTVDRATAAGLDFDRRDRSLAQARQIRQQAGATFADILLSKAKLRRRGNPDQVSIQESIAAFYRGIGDSAAADSRVSGDLGHKVIATCEKIIGKAKLKGRIESAGKQTASDPKPNVLVLGGTGFIGRTLIAQLLEKGHSVRAAARGSSPALEELKSDRLEIVRADMASPADLDRILEGVEYVFHLATTDAKTWNQFVDREIEPARALARACLERGVKRLIYTGTIDSFYAGARAGMITEQTPLDRKIQRRNYYARAKAAVEGALLEMHRKEGLPAVILRPGIVIGRGGNPFHWGVGKWSSPGVVELWGDGTNKLPLVLVDDVASGLLRAMEVPGIEGRTYNLIDEPMLSSRDYIANLERLGGFKIDARVRPIWKFWLEDLVKWPVKVAVGHPDAQRIPSYSDWESRTQKAVFDSSRTRQELGWKPISDPDRMVSEGIAGSLSAWLSARA